jgi:hypothetical protein
MGPPGGKAWAARAAALAFVVLAALSTPCAAASDEERIEAVTQFLLDRAKANYLYIFQLRIAGNRDVQCYFPTIYRYVSEGDLQILLKSRGLWSDSLEADLQRLVRAAGGKAVASLDPRGLASRATSLSNETMQYLTIRYQGSDYPLSSIDRNAPQELRDLAGGFYKITTVSEFFLQLAELTDATDDKCGIPNITEDDVKALGEDGKQALADLDAWRRHIRAHRNEIGIDEKRIETDCRPDSRQRPAALCEARDRLLERLEAAGNDMGAVLLAKAQLPAQLLKFGSDVKTATTKTEKVILAIQLLRDVGPQENDQVIQSLKQHVLFFAEVADAKDTAEVKAVLEAYTLPPVSFGLKREKYKDHLMVSAYVAYAYGKVLDSAEIGSRNNKGIYAPIGIEYTRGLGNSASLSFMAAPFDFGYPISLKLNGVTDGAQLSDVLAPSAALSYGFASYPLTAGIAYQRGRKDPASNQVEKRLMFFFGFDMPLYPLF